MEKGQEPESKSTMATSWPLTRQDTSLAWTADAIAASVAKEENFMRKSRGVKEVVKALRKGEKGLVIIAGDISPPDVISHIPVLCEDSSVPYIFIPSKEDLGSAGATKRPTSCVFVIPSGGKSKKNAEKAEEYKDAYDELVKEVATLE